MGVSSNITHQNSHVSTCGESVRAIITGGSSTGVYSNRKGVETMDLEIPGDPLITEKVKRTEP